MLALLFAGPFLLVFLLILLLFIILLCKLISMTGRIGRPVPTPEQMNRNWWMKVGLVLGSLFLIACLNAFSGGHKPVPTASAVEQHAFPFPAPKPEMH